MPGGNWRGIWILYFKSMAMAWDTLGCCFMDEQRFDFAVFYESIKHYVYSICLFTVLQLYSIPAAKILSPLIDILLFSSTLFS